MKKLILLCTLACISLISIAQPGGGRRGMPQLTPKQIANQKTLHLERELSLTEKQSNKVYKLYLSQAKKAEQALNNDIRQSFGGPPPMAGGGLGDLGDRQGPPSMGDRPHRGERGKGFSPKVLYQESEKDIKKRETKMKKILSDEQYQKWLVIEEENKRVEKDKKRKEELKKLFPELDLDELTPP